MIIVTYISVVAAVAYNAVVVDGCLDLTGSQCKDQIVYGSFGKMS